MSADPNYLSDTFYAIGDIHAELGSPQTVDVLRFIWRMRDPVIFLGDCIEGYQRGVNIEAMYRSRVVDAEFAMRLHQAGLEYRAVRGNHCNDTVFVRDWPDALMSTDCKIAALHGHRFDMFFATEQTEYVSDCASKLAYRLDRWGLTRAARATRGIRDLHWQENAFSWMRSRGVRLGIMGHTHNPGISVDKEGNVLAVCGSWKHGPPYSVVRVEHGRPMIMQWDGEAFI